MNNTEIVIPPKSKKTFDDVHYKEKKVAIDVYIIIIIYNYCFSFLLEIVLPRKLVQFQ